MIRIETLPKADSTFDEIFEFLIYLWNYKTALDFENLADDTHERLIINPYLGKPFYKNIRKVVLHKNASLFYEYFENESRIDILLYIDNRQNPFDYLKLLELF